MAAAPAPTTLGYAYTSLRKEVLDVGLEVQGAIPAWVSGVLYRNGPALFEFGQDTFNHWFDGQAMLHRFGIQHGKVTYSNKFLDTRNLRAHSAAKRIAVEEVQTAPPSRGFLDRLRTVWQPDAYENANVSVKALSGKLVALTEVPVGIEFKPCLDTVGPVKFSDSLSGVLSTAHPHILEDGRHLNYLTRFGRKTQYVLYTTPAQSDEDGLFGAPVKRTVEAVVTTDQASYMHSFGVSSHWYILVEFPYKFTLSKLILDRARYIVSNQFSGPFPDAFTWKPELGTTFVLVHRRNKDIVRVHTEEAIFSYHHINCFEIADGTVCIDLMCYKAPAYHQLTLANLRQSDILDQQGFVDGAQVVRWKLDVASGSLQRSVLHEGPCELPTIDYTRFNMKPYKTIYGVESTSTLVKVSLSGSAMRWVGANCSVGEPIFVPDPAADKDDIGVVLSVVFDSTSRTSFLLVLDAGSFLELARARLQHHIPPMLHGMFVPALQRETSNIRGSAPNSNPSDQNVETRSRSRSHSRHQKEQPPAKL